MKSFETKIPEKLHEYIETLVSEESFESVDAFINHAIYWLAELYGFGEQSGGKSLRSMITETVAPRVVPKTVSEPKETAPAKKEVKEHDIPNMDLIIESYSSSKFMFEDAIFAACQFAALKQGNPPISKEEFVKSIEQMEKAGILKQIQQGEKIMWKRNE